MVFSKQQLQQIEHANRVLDEKITVLVTSAYNIIAREEQQKNRKPVGFGFKLLDRSFDNINDVVIVRYEVDGFQKDISIPYHLFATDNYQAVAELKQIIESSNPIVETVKPTDLFSLLDSLGESTDVDENNPYA
jgi:hypothetical protein